jgi:hypothetical protein
MNQINFLPDSYIEQAQLARRRPVNLIAVVLTAAALGGAWLLGDRSEALAHRAEQLQGQVAELESAKQQARAIERQIADTRARHAIVREINPPVTTAQVLATLARLAPEPVKLTNLQLVAHRADPAPVPTGDGNPPAPAEARSNWLEVSIMGVAPDQATVVDLTEALTDHPLFTKVRPRSSGVTTAGPYQAREFLIVARIDLDRTFVAPSTLGEDRHE